MNFLFWNLHGRPLHSVVSALSSRYRVDVILLAECAIDVGTMLPALNSGAETQYSPCSVSGERVAVYSRFSRKFMVAEDRRDNFTIWRLTLPAREEILLVAAHLGSKLFMEAADKTVECIQLSEAIREAERGARHSKTLVVGDLNLNPFEEGVVIARGLNAVMTRRLAARKTRTVKRVKYPLFYNPMWRLFGERELGPPGTYYYGCSKQVCYFWNIFDQVLVRPKLVRLFDDHALRILDSDGSASLLNRAGVPNQRQFSDHLPVVFSLDL